MNFFKPNVSALPPHFVGGDMIVRGGCPLAMAQQLCILRPDRKH